MVSINVHTFGAYEVQQYFIVRSTELAARVEAIVRHYGQLLQTAVQAAASGRPGPNAPTGDYKRSINTQFSGAGLVATATVGTNKPQGRRLEFGFVGTDAIGRFFDQPPYPHFGPALSYIEHPFHDALFLAAIGV